MDYMFYKILHYFPTNRNLDTISYQIFILKNILSQGLKMIAKNTNDYLVGTNVKGMSIFSNKNLVMPGISV